jgi:hypothetical protein
MSTNRAKSNHASAIDALLNIQRNANRSPQAAGEEVERAIGEASPSAERKGGTISRTQEPVTVFKVVKIDGKEGKVFYRALTNKGVFFADGDIPKKFPCIGFLETRVTERRTYQTVYITGITASELRSYEKWLEEFRSYKKWL